jgi:hypothetical protein
VKKIDSKLKDFEKKIRTSFNTIKEEFEDHLDAINENTTEIQDNFDLMNRLDEKIEKLGSRIDEMALLFKEFAQEKEFKQISLSKNEEIVFKSLYTFGERASLSITDIARRTNLPELSVMRSLKSMLEKGVPILEEVIDRHSFYTLDLKFKQLQAKKNILGLSLQETY